MPRLVKSFINTKRDNYIAETNNQVLIFLRKVRTETLIVTLIYDVNDNKTLRKAAKLLLVDK